MVIEFRCPNGHRLNCPDERAGLPGKCPKCKAAFRVPQPAAADAPQPDAPISDSSVGEPELASQPSDAAAASDSGTGSEWGPPAEAASPSESGNFSFSSLTSSADSDNTAPPGAADETSETPDSQTAPPAAESAKPAEERIVFLCPKGHKLNCPASMQGRPGKCPHCGATFLVPKYEEEDEQDEEQPDDESSDDSSEPSDAEDSGQEPPTEQEPLEQENEGFNGDAYQADPFAFDFSSLTSEPQAGNAMAGVFQRLWLHKRTGGIVELYLKGGEVIAPEWFSPRQSQETYGMFAFAERDGSFTMTAVHWDAIERIAVRGVSALPQGMFDEEA